MRILSPLVCGISTTLTQILKVPEAPPRPLLLLRKKRRTRWPSQSIHQILCEMYVHNPPPTTPCNSRTVMQHHLQQSPIAVALATSSRRPYLAAILPCRSSSSSSTFPHVPMARPASFMKQDQQRHLMTRGRVCFPLHV
ncbi:hypothetical protein NA56DRAFT_136676 [Hyaloscypha hepaticicola]|uniref:Uncharacterized protein n=1 Tax=Hyaloscypha hepaticicola TaxID=2082293 RepID=A0A2J6QML1_9HELO|nr:hypothetical protein NA56DRAFT_136676 [Hyaloscypha hepaticicola]